MGMTAICRATPHADARPSFSMRRARGASMNCKYPRVGARSVHRRGLQRAFAAALEDATLPADDRPFQRAPTPNAANFEKLTPGKADAERFQLHPSVFYWQDRPAISKTDTISAARDLVEMPSKRLRDAVASGDPTRMAYWSYHVARTTFFAVQSAVGVFAASSQQLEESEAKVQTVIDRGDPEMMLKTVRSLMRESLDAYEQDLQMIEAGSYKLPWDMTTLGHRQYNPLFVMQRALGFVEEARDVVKRRRKQAEPRIWLDSDMYPNYYLSTFHFQTDGWMSRRSARVYEDSTESLFLGRQDAMQRQTLVPIHNWMQGRDPGAVRMLEVAAGTGRFATFVKDNYPTAHLTVSDLSPFYLEEARSNMQYWKRMRAPQLDMGGEDGTGAAFVQAAAEKLPFSDASFDLLYCVYLFHELPLEVRSMAVAEFSRVLKPGGLLVLTDSQQHDDHKNLPYDIEAFGKFNEPHYVDYVSTDLGALFEEHGLTCGEKVMMSATKVLSAVKI